jgi:hypothetical protein
MSEVIIEDPTWHAIMADERLAGARRKLSFHEIRLIIQHAKAASTPLPDGLEELRRLSVGVTPGEWIYEPDQEGSSMGWISAPRHGLPEIELFDVNGDSAEQAINAEFAAAAVNYVRAMLATVEPVA